MLACACSVCRGAPSIVVAGAYFPVWLVCASVGLLMAIVARALFVATGLAQTLPLQLAVCLSLGTLGAALVWLLWMR